MSGQFRSAEKLFLYHVAVTRSFKRTVDDRGHRAVLAAIEISGFSLYIIRRRSLDRDRCRSRGRCAQAPRSCIFCAAFELLLRSSFFSCPTICAPLLTAHLYLFISLNILYSMLAEILLVSLRLNFAAKVSVASSRDSWDQLGDVQKCGRN